MRVLPTLGRSLTVLAMLAAVCTRPELASAGVQNPPPAAPTPRPAPQPSRPSASAPARAARPSLEIEVTDSKGATLADVHVRLTGSVEREGTTDAQGAVAFVNLRPGTYRLRFDRNEFVSFEREATVPATGRAAPIAVALTAAPPPPPPPPPAPATPPPSTDRGDSERPAGEPRTLQVPSFAESNFIGRGEPQKLSVVGCTGYATTRLLQLRDPLTNRVNADADETLYVVAGEATLRLQGADRSLDPGSLAVIPRGMTHTLTRRGRNPTIFVSVLSGPACQDAPK